MGETRMSPCRTILWSLVALALVHACLSSCYRTPQGATGDRSPVDDNYQIIIDGNPSTYLPGQAYNISLSCAKGLTFISFTLVVETEKPPTLADNNKLLGKFEITSVAETKFSNLCENMIESSNNNIKHRIDVTWVAPDDPESDCVLFKAAVLQHRNVWFVDDGYLTKSLCREHVDQIHSQSPAVDPCCACDEAKYEIVLERKWTRNTHPKKFPAEAWRTKFGTLIGTSHKVNQSFWNYGTKASPGMEELAEHGSTTKLENEIKSDTERGNFRTIIKAPSVEYKENVVTRSLATARVTPEHHMISLVSKIVPSPDWIVGVSSLELCLPDCRWIEEKVLNLYPWDLGTDGGVSYMSADQAQKPPDVVRPITSTYPSDPNAPFYDKTGAPMKPLGVLRVTRKRTYGGCKTVPQDNLRAECETHPWTEWSECSVKCGPGIQSQTRTYKNPVIAKNVKCREKMTQTQPCSGQCFDYNIGLQQHSQIHDIPDPRYSNAECELTQWSQYSECSTRCGMGIRTRTRGYVNAYATNNCQRGPVPVELMQTQDCKGTYCGGSIRSDGNRFSSEYDQPQSMDYSAGTGNNQYESSIFESSDLKSQIPSPSSTRYDNGASSYGNTNQIYGSAQLRGNSPNSFENPPSLAGDLESPYGDNNSRNRPTNQYQYGQTTSWGSNQYPSPYVETTTPPRTFGDFGTDSYNTPRTSNFNSPITDEAGSYAGELELCLQKPVASLKPCKAQRAFIKNYWFYDAFDMECKLFTADNCDLNKNKFLKLEECESECGGMSYGINRNTGVGYESPMYDSRNERGGGYDSATYGNRNTAGGYGSSIDGDQSFGGGFGSTTYDNRNTAGGYGSSIEGDRTIGGGYGSATYGNQNSGGGHVSSTGGGRSTGGGYDSSRSYNGIPRN